MPDQEAIASLRLAHGAFNSLVLLCFFMQGAMGLKIRKARLSGTPAPALIKRHRAFGPVIAVLGIAGFFAGLVLVYLDKGRFMEYPVHFAGGLSVAFLIVLVFSVSRKIGPDAPGARRTHATLGLCLLAVYPVQAFFGLGILL